MKLSKLGKLIDLDLTLPMKIKADDSIKVGDIIGVNYGIWECAIVKEIISANEETKIKGYFCYCNNKIILDNLKSLKNKSGMKEVYLFKNSQKYMLRL